LRNAKSSIVTVLYAIPIAIISFALTSIDQALLGFFIGITGLISLRYLYPLVRIDIALFEKKNWLGSGAIFFFTWLAVWILICNPPFNDLANPTIDRVECSIDGGGNWTALVPDPDWNNIQIGNNNTTIIIRARIADNDRLDSNSIKIIVDGTQYDLAPSEKDYYTYTIVNVHKGATYDIKIMSKDVGGRSSEYHFVMGTS
jgi:hypothetical protein